MIECVAAFCHNIGIWVTPTRHRACGDHYRDPSVMSDAERGRMRTPAELGRLAWADYTVVPVDERVFDAGS